MCTYISKNKCIICNMISNVQTRADHNNMYEYIFGIIDICEKDEKVNKKRHRQQRNRIKNNNGKIKIKFARVHRARADGQR